MKITKELATKAFAAWLAQNEPELFAALAERAQSAAPAAGVAGLGDWTSLLSSIGSGIASAVSNVASYVGSAAGVNSLTSLAQTYLTSKNQKNALQVQLAQAQAAKPPAPIETRYDAATNTYVPVYTPAPTASVPNPTPIPLTADLSAQLLSQTQGFNWQKWLPWIAGGGAGLILLVIVLHSRNRA